MSKRLIIILALAFVVGLTAAAYAEVQNVKVSGDITVSGVLRDNFDLNKTYSIGSSPDGKDYQDRDRDFLSITRVRVDADLTDNVSATVRLLNERNWNGESTKTGTANRNIGLNVATSSNENRIDLDLAYVGLKEFLYSPLTLTIGRQELHFGNELIVGDPDTNVYSARTQLAEGDLSARKSFDAVRVTLDYNPLVLDGIYAKVQEGEANLHDDITLTGVNASYALNKNTTLEAYMFNKVTGSSATQVYNLDAASATTGFRGLKHDSDIVYTVGLRAVDKTIKNLTLDGQVAYQFGRYNPIFDANARYDITTGDSSTIGGRIHKRSAMAVQAQAAYDLKDIAMISKYNPVLSAGYTYLSGADRDLRPNKSYKGWDPMFENQTQGHIMNAIFANTNVHKGLVSAKAKLTDDVSANVDYVFAWFAKHYPNNKKAILSGVYGVDTDHSGRIFYLKDGAYIGQEIDACLTYDYTEDVQFSLLGGILIPGNNIRAQDSPNNKDNIASATELIGSMKVTF